MNNEETAMPVKNENEPEIKHTLGKRFGFYIHDIKDEWEMTKCRELKERITNGEEPFLTKTECHHIRRMFNEELRDCQFRIKQLYRLDAFKRELMGSTVEGETHRITEINEICYKLNRWENIIDITDDMFMRFVGAFQTMLGIRILMTKEMDPFINANVVEEGREYEPVIQEFVKQMKQYKSMTHHFYKYTFNMQMVLSDLKPVKYLWKMERIVKYLTVREVYDIANDMEKLDAKYNSCIEVMYIERYRESCLQALYKLSHAEENVDHD